MMIRYKTEGTRARRALGWVVRALLLAVGPGGGTVVCAQQPWGVEFATRPAVVVGTDSLRNPWAGGFNTARFSKMDFDQDGVADLLVWDGRGQRPLTFVARGGQWHYAPAYEAAFPEPDPGKTATYALLRDYDGDGHPDLFINANQYVRLYRQELTPGVGVGFRFVRVSAPYLQTQPAPAPQPLFDIEIAPWTSWDVVDIDADGDLDLLHWRYLGAAEPLLERNTAGVGALPVFAEDPAWGGIRWCGGRGQNYSFAASGTLCRPAGPQHGGNPAATLTAADLDNDGDRDLLIGQEYVADVALLLNQGTPAQESFGAGGLEAPWLANTAHPAQLLHAPAASYEDVTFDGQPDVLLSPWLVIPTPFVADDLFDARQSAALFAGGASGPVFRQPDFLQSGMIDVGENAAPTLGDLDGDGDLDLLIGNAGDYLPDPSGRPAPAAYRAQLRFYRNVGTPQGAIFRLEQTDFGQFSALNRRALVPVLTDLDGDGAVDLVLRYSADAFGVGARAMTFFRNVAPAGQLAEYPLSAERTFAFQINRTGNRDLLCFYDVDGDGRRDILLGTDQYIANVPTALHYVRNRGGAPDTAFVLADPQFGRLVTTLPAVTGWSPAVTDLNGDGQPELLTASADGELRVWPQLLQQPTLPTPPIGELVRNDLTTVFGAARLGHQPILTTGDLDGDGRAEVLVGTTGGGVRLLRYQPNGLVGTPAPRPTLAPLTVFPNPAVGAFTVGWPGAEAATLELLDNLGRVVQRTTATAPARLDVTALPAGVYSLRVAETNGAVRRARVVVAPNPQP